MRIEMSTKDGCLVMNKVFKTIDKDDPYIRNPLLCGNNELAFMFNGWARERGVKVVNYTMDFAADVIKVTVAWL